MKTQRWLAIFLAMTGLMTAQAATRYVSLDGTNDVAGGYTNWSGAATNVNDAVWAAYNKGGEIVWISNGVFCLTNIMYMYDETLRSVNGRDRVIINGMANGWGAAASAGFHIYSFGTIDGITMSNGYTGASDGSGQSSGGIFSYATIINSKITHCTTGGSVFQNGGGGVTMYSGLMTNCIIQNCYCVNGGGGVFMYGFAFPNTTIMKDCIIQNNLNGGNIGGGLAVTTASGGSPLIENCIIRNNTNTAVAGGGIYVYNGGRFRNCLVVSNYLSGVSGGGGIGMSNLKLNDTTGSFVNCTIVDNVALTGGGGIKVDDASYNASTIINCIVYSNYADLAHTTPNDITLADPVSSNAFLYSRLTNNIPSDRHCITGNPLLVDCAGGNYRLSANSPCINAGTNQDWWMTNAVDLDVQIRIRYGTVDMGSYEHIQSGTIYTFH